MTRGLFAAWGKTPRWLLKPLAATLGLGLFLFGLIALGKMAWQQVRDHDRYTVPFSDIDCAPPPGQKRVDFLDEVQYLAGMPDHIRLLDEGLSTRLAQAFAGHPMVDNVAQIVLIPPRQIQVRLIYRKPVLAVPVAGQLRAVDGSGVLLPKNTPTHGLPRFQGKAALPVGPPGTRWGDPMIEEAARKLTSAHRETTDRQRE
jgi:hypothetical protein